MTLLLKRLVAAIFCCLLFSANASAQQHGEAIRVACVGNSITYGAGIANRERDSYPAVLGQMLGRGYDVRNYGISARTMLMKGELPYMKERFFEDVKRWNPNVIVVKLGTNDTKPQNWKHKADFERDLQTMVSAFKSLPAEPEIFLCHPAKAYYVQWGINDSIIVNGVVPVVNKVARRNGLKTIDLHTATSGLEAHFPDKIHPDPVGAHRIAATVYKAITGKEANHERQAFPGYKSTWEGCDRYDFNFRGRDAIVVMPKEAAPGKPWIWRPAFFGAFPSVDKALLKKGFHVVYLDVTHNYGSPQAVQLGTDFYNYLTSYYGLSQKVTLEGFSRGGLYAFNWAARNASKVACLYVDAPVCDVKSWPSRKNKQLWTQLLAEWQLTDTEMGQFKGNPVDNLEPLAQAGVPIISVCGEADQTVPFAENMAVVRSRYRALGGNVELILKPGVDHHPHSLDDPAPVVDFILRYQPGYDRFVHFTPRGNMRNSFLKFENERKGRVAFLGGSITEMQGWKNLVEQQLRQRFPYTEFEFVEAGIGSTGSTPGAFRLQHDVLSAGVVDLLFVEAAVNDHTNGFAPQEQVRGMEGEVRHALLANPFADIVMLHFIYDPFISMVGKGQRPDVVFNHERVANHYLVPSVDLVQEIGERMSHGQFTWEQFGGTHPAPFGHKYYAASIGLLLDEMWRGLKPGEQRKAHEVPGQPLDRYSYFGGDFIPLKEAGLSKGWQYVEKWRANDSYEKRRGFVDVPMLEAKKPGSKLTLDFTGTAIGVFCTPGPDAGMLEYSIDGAPFKTLDTYTQWSGYLYIPWLYMLDDELDNKAHRLVLRVAKQRNPSSKGYACQIRNFVVNR